MRASSPDFDRAPYQLCDQHIKDLRGATHVASCCGPLAFASTEQTVLTAELSRSTRRNRGSLGRFHCAELHLSDPSYHAREVAGPAVLSRDAIGHSRVQGNLFT